MTVNELVMKVYRDLGMTPEQGKEILKETDFSDPAISFAGRIELCDEEAEELERIFKAMLQLPREVLEVMLADKQREYSKRATMN